MELKRIGGRPRNISRVLDSHADVPDGRPTNINTGTNSLQFREYQTHAIRWKDKEAFLLVSSPHSFIEAASHWFSQTKSSSVSPAFSYDYQLPPKRFMIVSHTAGIERAALGRVQINNDFDQPL